MSMELIRAVEDLRRRLDLMEAGQYATDRVTFLAAPLTSTSWDGDAYSTAAKTLIDLSAVFSVPAGVRAVYVRVSTRDSGSAGSTLCGIRLAPNDTADSAAVACLCSGVANDAYTSVAGLVPCDANGDIYYQTTATGAGTLDVIIQVWGYVEKG